jgi:hypothetical protein
LTDQLTIEVNQLAAKSGQQKAAAKSCPGSRQLAASKKATSKKRQPKPPQQKGDQC